MEESKLYLRLARKRAAVFGKGLAIEEPFMQEILQTVVARGTEHDVYYASLDLFHMYCRYGEQEKAIGLLPNFTRSNLEPGDDCSRAVAESLIESFDDFENALRMVHHGYKSSGEGDEPAARLFHRWKLKCLELRIHAHTNPKSESVARLFDEIQKYWTDAPETNLHSAIVELISKASLPKNRRPLLIRAWAALMARQRFFGEHVSTQVKQIERMLR